MRIIGHIEHPTLKITVFKMGERISVKFENGGYEQTFKLGQDDRLANLAAVQQWADATLLQQVQATFQQLHQAHLAALERAFPTAQMVVFEDII
ncbi:MAG: hypothetical protein LH618_00040 [Saprospiraceae bacterium]|nr:hypothetical protein [Saprospiraceae bacterium]